MPRVARRALITGITGQDGSYLAKLLLSQGCEVYGAYRRSASTNFWRLEELGIAEQVTMMPFDLLEFTNVFRTLEKVRPTEIYNLAAQSFVGLSFEQPIYTGDVDGIGVARLLEAVRSIDPSIRFYQAGTSEMFGKVQQIPQTEATPFYPRSPYGAAKLYAHWMCVNYREAYGIHACNGILFNHESPMRGREFVTRKITAAFAEMKRGRTTPLELGNLDARRDWGFAGDYVEGMTAMLQQEKPDDFVLATGVQHSVRSFCESAAAAAGYQLVWSGQGTDEIGTDRETGRQLVRINPQHYRPAEVETLLGDASKAKSILGWQPKTTFDQLVESMVRADLDRLQRGTLR
jgi:GDPmannose 4,6-dehydratase